VRRIFNKKKYFYHKTIQEKELRCRFVIFVESFAFSALKDSMRSVNNQHSINNDLQTKINFSLLSLLYYAVVFFLLPEPPI